MTRYVKSGTVGTVQEINSELEKIAVAQEEFLSREGESPNEMKDTLDMNNNRLINLPAPASPTDAVRSIDLPNFIVEGNDLLLITREESQVLTAGQTLVTFSDLTTTQTAYYISGISVDQGRLINGTDYSVDSTTQITLTDSYPEGTRITAVQNEGVEEVISDVQVFDNVASMKSASLSVGDTAMCKRYYAGGELVDGLVYEIQASATVDGYVNHTLSNGNVAALIHNGTVDVSQAGVVGDGTTDTSSQLNVVIANTSVESIVIPKNEYLLGSKISVLVGKRIFSEGAVLLKNHDGVGIEFNNGAQTVDIFGRLDIKGNGSFAGDGQSISTSPDAHGVLFSNARVRVNGALWSYNHQGCGAYFDANVTGNANKSDFATLRCDVNNGHGIYCDGNLTDDQSVWRVGFYAFGNYKSGFATSSDYNGRNWSGLVYCESNGNDGVSDEFAPEKLRDCNLDVYAESGVGGTNEVVLGAGVSNCQIRSYRSNLDNDNSTTQNNRWVRGADVYNAGTEGGSRIGNVGGFRFNRARASSPNEGVKVPLRGLNFDFGFLTGVNSSKTGSYPYVGLENDTGNSYVRVGETDLKVNSGGTSFVDLDSNSVFNVGSTNVSKPTKVNVFGTVNITGGFGSPEGNVVASRGCLYLRADGGAGTTLYVKESGSGNTGWVGK